MSRAKKRKAEGRKGKKGRLQQENNIPAVLK